MKIVRCAAVTLRRERLWPSRTHADGVVATPAGGAVELHQVGVRNPMADDREKGFSDVNLGV